MTDLGEFKGLCFVIESKKGAPKWVFLGLWGI